MSLPPTHAAVSRSPQGRAGGQAPGRGGARRHRAGGAAHARGGGKAAAGAAAAWVVGLLLTVSAALPPAAGAQGADEAASAAEPPVAQPGEAGVGDSSTLTVPTATEPAAPGGGPAEAEPATGFPGPPPAGPDAEARGAGPVDEAEAAERFVEANQAYEAGEHGRAIELYRQLLAAGHGSGHLHYNLGNAYLRGGELGRAIAAYRRAQALLPRDRDVEANLTFARRSARDALAPPAPSPVLSTLFFWHYGLSRPELVRLTVVLNLLFWGLLAARLFRPASELLRWLAVLALILLLAVGGSLAVKLIAPQQVAVVLPQEIAAHSGTGTDTVVRFKLQAGAELRLVERREGWLRIALPDGQQAWIEQRHAEVVPF